MTFRHLLTLLLIPLTCTAAAIPLAPRPITPPPLAPTTAPAPFGPPSLGPAAAAPPPTAPAPSAPPPAGSPPRPGAPPSHLSPGSELPRAGPGTFVWPLAPPHPVVRPFEPPPTPYGPGHRGVDLGTALAAPVLAAGDGVVVFAGPVAGRGVISIDHPGGIRTTYEPVVPAVVAGQRVERGTVIGTVTAGHCPEACLHWGARRGDEYLDPLGLLSTGRVRLKPWDGA